MQLVITYNMLKSDHIKYLEGINALRNAGFEYDPTSKRKVDPETLVCTVVMVLPAVEKAQVK